MASGEGRLGSAAAAALAPTPAAEVVAAPAEQAEEQEQAEVGPAAVEAQAAAAEPEAQPQPQPVGRALPAKTPRQRWAQLATVHMASVAFKGPAARTARVPLDFTAARLANKLSTGPAPQPVRAWQILWGAIRACGRPRTSRSKGAGF